MCNDSTNNHTNIQTIAQRRAAFALKAAQKVMDKDKKEWLSRSNEIPAMIQMNGLGQTMAFYLSKQGIHTEIADVLAIWLCNEQNMFPNITIHNDPKQPSATLQLMGHITDSTMKEYQCAQAEAQAFLVWLKKLSRAYCKKEEPSNASSKTNEEEQ